MTLKETYNTAVHNHTWSVMIIGLLLLTMYLETAIFLNLAVVACFLAMAFYSLSITAAGTIIRNIFKDVLETEDPDERTRKIKELEEGGMIWRGEDSISFIGIVAATHAARDMIMSYKYVHIFFHLIFAGVIMILFSQLGMSGIGVTWFLYKFVDGTVTIGIKHKLEQENI